MTDPSGSSDIGRLAEASLEHQFLPFSVGEHNLALGLVDVREIIHIPEIVEIPNSPSVLSGLANLRGSVLPIVDLRTALAVAGEPEEDSSRILVCGEGSLIGLRADRIHPVAVVEPNQIDTLDALASSYDEGEEVVDGLIRLGDAPDIFGILSIDRLMRREFKPQERNLRPPPAPSNRTLRNDRSDEPQARERKLVGFTLGGEEFALPIEEVQEVVRVPSKIVPLTTPRPHITGIITLRDTLLPLVDLNGLLNVTPENPIEDREIIILRNNGTPDAPVFGLIADGIREVLSVPEAVITDSADIVERIDTARLVDGVCRLQSGARLIPLLSPKRLLKLVNLSDLSTEHAQDQSPETAMTDETDATEAALEVVIYQLDGQEFAVPIAAVQEIIGVPDRMTRLPKAPPYVRGVINLRGTVLPVINLRTKLSLPPRDSEKAEQILVLSVGDMPTGFVVDAVSEVLRAPRSALRPALDIEGAASAMVKEVISLDDSGRMIMLISSEMLLSRDLEEEPVAAADEDLASAASG
ncbi:MAG: chemotaxis protein CheW [Pseudomonadota bacterium]